MKPAKVPRLSFPKYQFTTQGQWVAVFYDVEFYVGQVLEVKSPSEAVVTFLQTCGLNSSVLRWPSSPDIDTVSSKYIFATDFDMTTKNARIWTTTDMKKLCEMYVQYKQLYCE